MNREGREVRLGRRSTAWTDPGSDRVVLRHGFRLGRLDLVAEDEWSDAEPGVWLAWVDAAPRPRRPPLPFLTGRKGATLGAAAAFVAVVAVVSAAAGGAAYFLAGALDGAGEGGRADPPGPLAPLVDWALRFLGAGGRGPAETDLEASSLVLLQLDEGARVRGFVKAHNLAPGDRVDGTATLSTDQASRNGTLAFRVDLSSAPRLREALVVETLSYGGTDLLPAARALDADRDGRLTLGELRPGLAGLPGPAWERDGGTPFRVGVRFDPDAAGDGSAFAGEVLDAVFTFTLERAEVARRG